MNTVDGVLIPLYCRGKVAAWAIVDDEDFERIDERCWHYDRVFGGAVCHDRSYGGALGMHRFLFGLQKGDPRIVHHRNEARLDNRKANLQVCTDASEHARLPHPFRDIYAPRWSQARLRERRVAA